MTAQNDLDRTLGAWFHGDATTTPPAEPLARVIESTRNVRPRNALLAALGSSWTAADATDGFRGAMAGLRPAIVLALALLLALALAGGALLVGGRLAPHPSKPAPFSQYRNGVIAVAKDGDIFVADRPGGELHPLVTGPEDDGAPMFTPDGKKLVFSRDGALMLADADGSNVVQVAPAGDGNDSRWRLAPDGRSLVGLDSLDGSWTGRVVVRSLDPGAAPVVLDLQLQERHEALFEWGGPEFRPTNAQEILIVGTLEPDGPRGIYVYDLATKAIRTVMEPAVGVFDVKWSANGESISYGLDAEGPGSGIHVIAADGSGERLLDRGPFTISPWSNDGSRIVVARAPEDGGRELDVITTGGGGGTVNLACGTSMDVECPERLYWSPDDSMLVGTLQDDINGTRTFVADPATGTVAKLDWNVELEDPQQWQRVAP
jgi:Tol biopolymer transport system component